MTDEKTNTLKALARQVREINPKDLCEAVSLFSDAIIELRRVSGDEDLEKHPIALSWLYKVLCLMDLYGEDPFDLDRSVKWAVIGIEELKEHGRFI